MDGLTKHSTGLFLLVSFAVSRKNNYSRKKLMYRYNHFRGLKHAHTPLSLKHTHTHFIDVCHGFDGLDCTALLLIITERKITKPVLSGRKIKKGTK